MTAPELGDAIALAWGAGAALILGTLLVVAVLGSCVRGARFLANCLRSTRTPV